MSSYLRRENDLFVIVLRICEQIAACLLYETRDLCQGDDDGRIDPMQSLGILLA